MSKETILKEFMNLKFENKQHFGRCSDGEMIFEKVFEPLLSKAINQTREETIMDILDNAIMYLKASDLSTFSKEYKQGYKDAFLDLERYKIKLKK